MKLAVLVLLACLGLTSAAVHRMGGNKDRDGGKKQMIKTNQSPKQHHIKTVGWTDTCSSCKEIVEEAKAAIDDEAKINEIKMILGLFCDVLPGSEKDECKNLVANIDALVNEIRPLVQNPEQLCESLHLCGGSSGSTSKAAKVVLMLLKYRILPAGQRRSSAFCDECKFAVTEAKAAWDTKSIQNKAKDLLEQICDMVGSYKGQCDSLLDAYFPLLVQEVDQLLSDPDATCSEIGLCSSAVFSTQGQKLTPAKPGKASLHMEERSAFLNFLARSKRIQTRLGVSSGCSVCVYSLGALLETLKLDPQLLQSWANGIQNLCNEFPDDFIYREGCNDFLHMYLEPVLRVTVDTVQPKQVCTMIKACTAATYQEVMEYSMVQLPEGKVQSEVLCESCRLLAEFVKTELQSQTFQDEIKGELEQVCNFVPGQYSQQCSDVVEQYTPYLLNLIVTEVDPDTVCPELNLCPQTSVPARPASLEEEE